MSIISLSGKANSGKDLVGQIIQYLTEKNNSGMSYFTDMSNKNPKLIDDFNGFIERNIKSEYEIKKWADKLKDIVCLLTGCTRAQLEDRGFKESELGEEWWQYKTDAYNYDGSEFCEEKIFKSEVEALEYVKTNPRKYEYIEYIGVFKPTYRYLLQHIGTDLLRDQLHPQIWVNALMGEYKDTHEMSTYGHNGKYPDWIISDTRFPNELQAVKDRGGLTIKVERIQMSDDKRYIIGFDPFNEHISETALDSAEFDEVIINNGSIEELIEKVKAILIKYKII